MQKAIANERYLLAWGEDGVESFKLGGIGTCTNAGVGPYDHRPTHTEINTAIKNGTKFPQWDDVDWSGKNSSASNDAVFAREMIGRLSDAEESMLSELGRNELKIGVVGVASAILLGTLYGVFVKGGWPFDLLGTFVFVLSLCGLAWLYRQNP